MWIGLNLIRHQTRADTTHVRWLSSFEPWGCYLNNDISVETCKANLHRGFCWWLEITDERQSLWPESFRGERAEGLELQFGWTHREPLQIYFLQSRVLAQRLPDLRTSPSTAPRAQLGGGCGWDDWAKGTCWRPSAG